MGASLARATTSAIGRRPPPPRSSLAPRPLASPLRCRDPEPGFQLACRSAHQTPRARRPTRAGLTTNPERSDLSRRTGYIHRIV
jgi:hypothetical protein